ncbi:NAD-dependent epimerase/dehydratase family protein [Deinococcus maricopensis]|uniref:NAD-dependent epimerase/dehydratase n=1 Tax=Deinococcus maricopensis (strain DSM 21211 / LMG 22137 / NRRL B-23946 / LB-34) TaxID=709986 RepID=E8UB55_DEIML|nr:NAD(P)-dependent oxidoreductase [Deinococcus maricopensis]ADV68294.1 NAD-dependent epimerase/dehydratase [Deinococcus maricopensis DSM 21211]
MNRILITGAAGEIGRALRAQLPALFPDTERPTLRLTDIAPLGEAGAGEEVMQADLTDAAQMLEVLRGVDGVVHLGGIPNEHTYDMIRRVNMDGTQHVYEAARQAGARRVVFASSIHTVGYHPRTPITPDVPVRPDTFYGVSKVFGEALGRMYVEKHGLEVVNVRICSFQERPRDRRHLSTWLSPRDAAQLVYRGLTAPGITYLTVAGISGNTRAWMTPDGWDALGYVPQDDAEAYASEVEPLHGPEDAISERTQGGVFTEPDYVGLAK